MDNFEKGEVKFLGFAAGWGCLAVVLALLVNVGLFVGAIYAICLVLRHFGVIN